MYPSYVSHTHLGTDLEVEVKIHKEYMWIHDDTPRYTGYIQNTEKIRILTTIHAKYTKIRIEAKPPHLGGKNPLFPDAGARGGAGEVSIQKKHWVPQSTHCKTRKR